MLGPAHQCFWAKYLPLIHNFIHPNHSSTRAQGCIITVLSNVHLSFIKIFFHSQTSLTEVPTGERLTETIRQVYKPCSVNDEVLMIMMFS